MYNYAMACMQLTLRIMHSNVSVLYYGCIYTVQVNAVLLTVSMVSLAKSQCGRMENVIIKDKVEQAEQYLKVGK